jgi:hypothetical protein
MVSSDALPTHVRTPRYCQGVIGEVLCLHGEFPNPEDLAYHGDGRPMLALYQVKFRQSDLWQEYPGPSTDYLVVDVYENWLQPKETFK